MGKCISEPLPVKLSKDFHHKPCLKRRYDPYVMQLDQLALRKGCSVLRDCNHEQGKQLH